MNTVLFVNATIGFSENLGFASASYRNSKNGQNCKMISQGNKTIIIIIIIIIIMIIIIILGCLRGER